MESGCRYSGVLPSQTGEIIRSIVDCTLSGFNRKIFLEGKALELLFSKLSQLDDRAARCRQTCGLSCSPHPQDKKQTEEARNQLLSNIETPPCLIALARSVGMSHPKLNRCFKHMYGMTVFQYLRYERLNKARGMLENEGVTVTETAYQVGYDSLSHFSQAYKKQFGQRQYLGKNILASGGLPGGGQYAAVCHGENYPHASGVFRRQHQRPYP